MKSCICLARYRLFEIEWLHWWVVKVNGKPCICSWLGLGRGPDWFAKWESIDEDFLGVLEWCRMDKLGEIGGQLRSTTRSIACTDGSGICGVISVPNASGARIFHPTAAAFVHHLLGFLEMAVGSLDTRTTLVKWWWTKRTELKLSPSGHEWKGWDAWSRWYMRRA